MIIPPTMAPAIIGVEFEGLGTDFWERPLGEVDGEEVVLSGLLMVVVMRRVVGERACEVVCKDVVV